MCQTRSEDMSSYSEGQTHQLMTKLEAAGYTADDITKLGQSKHLPKIKDVLNGCAVISYPKHLIDCDAAPFQLNGWSVEKHIKGGQFEWNPTRVKLYLAKSQKPGKLVEGNKLRKELEGQLVLNANVLDYLLAHPELIPDEWKGKAVFFWGTIYRYSNGNLFVRCLFWHDSRWDWDLGWLDSGFYDSFPAAVSASI